MWPTSTHSSSNAPLILVDRLHRAGRAGLGNRHVLRVYSSDNYDVFLIACESLSIGTFKQ